MTHLLCLLNHHAWGEIVLPPPTRSRVSQHCTRPGCRAFRIKAIPNPGTLTPLGVAALASSEGWSKPYTPASSWDPNVPSKASYGGHTGKKVLAEEHPVPPKTLGTMGGFHGGDLGFDLGSPEGQAHLQRMLPQGSSSSIGHPACSEAGNPQVEASSPEPTGIALTLKLLKDLRKATEDWHAAHDLHMERQKLKDHIYCRIAETIAMAGTCCRLKVGCVMLTKEGSTCGMGYNGAGPGMPHCDPSTCNETCRCRRTRHAEKNALSSRSGQPHTVYLTHEPCEACAKDLIAEGVRRVVYISPYSSIGPEERAARQEWIDFYGVSWEQLDQEA